MVVAVDSRAIVGVIRVRIVSRTCTARATGTACQQGTEQYTRNHQPEYDNGRTFRQSLKYSHTVHSSMGLIDFIIPRSTSLCAFVVAGGPI